MAISNITESVKAATKVVPQIYSYSTPEIKRHDGWTKIGYTERDVDTRIWEQTHTANIQAKKEWQGNAIYEDGTGDSFTDHEFHAYLTKLGIDREPNTEWFLVDGLGGKMHFYEFRSTRGILTTEPAIPYKLRREQLRASEQTSDYALLHEQGEFLWNAKPRFGKTLTAYDFCKRIGAVKVLIVTNRPAIANSWYEDYVKFLGSESGYSFVSSTSALQGLPHVMTRDEYLKHIQAVADAGMKKVIEFVSLQDLKGSLYFGGNYDKLREVADLTWDVLIVDEAHEGVDTYKTDVAFDHIKRKFTLHLSGTPFKALANDKFPEDAIFNWTYADEQAAKAGWDDPELKNPYADLPQLNMFTYQMSELVEQQVAAGIDIDGEIEEYAFDLNEFFATNQNGHFLHNEDVDRFLDALTTQTKYPFSTPELRDELRHTLWMLNRVDSAKALAKKLKKHPVFSEYEIVVAAGDGKLDDDDENEKAFNRVRAAIEAFDKTITISVGQLTTGVTIPEWTAVLMLSNMRSAALYMQAAFRAQNPCLFQRNGEYLRKQNAYVFDFDPARTLDIYEQFANDLYSETSGARGDTDQRKKHILTLLNFFPVLGEDPQGEMVELDAEQVLAIPRKIRSREVVRRGFMSNFLFQNISNIFSAPAAVRDIIENFEPFKEPQKDLGIDDSTASELDLNAEGEVEIPEEQIIGKSTDLFGEKIYGEIEDDLAEVIDGLTVAPATKSEEDRQLEALAQQFTEMVAKPLVETAKQNYGADLKASHKKHIERKIKADADSMLHRKMGDYKIQRNMLEKERLEAIAAAETDAEEEAANREFEQKSAEALQKFKDDLRSSRDELVKSAGQDVVRTVETAKKEQKKRDIEDGIRDHLRGFSRTIPSFLMAYGDENTTLEAFDTIIPDEVFKDVTSITLAEFRFLRDGGDFENPETGEIEHFDGHLFDPVVFNDSVKEFISLRTRLADYFDEGQNEDIFDYVPPQKTNQIYTPKRVVEQMVDLFEQENPGCFDDPTHTFADMYMKSGLYITEIVKRLYRSERMKELFPNEEERLRHIFDKQVFGAAPTEIIYRIATRFILGFSGENGNWLDSNFVLADTAELAKEGKLAEFMEKSFGDKL